MKTRIGKIARLPQHIRDELNRRLANGARSADVLPWLNALPETQKVVSEQFAGKAIRAQNISEWRKGGYAEWTASRSGVARWQDLIKHIDELSQERSLANGNDVASELGTLVLLELAQSLDQLSQMEDSAERWKIFRHLSLSISRLRRDDCRQQRLRLSGCHTADPT